MKLDKILVDDINERVSILQKRILDGTATNDEVDEFTRLIRVKSYLKPDSKLSESMKLELVKGGISLTALLLILKYEELNVITTKGFSIFQKLLR